MFVLRDSPMSHPTALIFKETEKADRHLNQIHHYGEA